MLFWFVRFYFILFLFVVILFYCMLLVFFYVMFDLDYDMIIMWIGCGVRSLRSEGKVSKMMLIIRDIIWKFYLEKVMNWVVLIFWGIVKN